MITAADKAYHANEVNEAIMRLNHHFASRCVMPRIEWNLKGVSRLGTATGSTLIKLNAQYADNLGRDAYRQTVLHEACHIVTVWRRVNEAGLGHQSSGKWAPHGAEWRRAMRVLQLNPDRTCSVPLAVQAKMKPARTVRKRSVACACQVHQVTLAAYAKIEAGAKYRCKGCRQPVLPFVVVDDLVVRSA